MKQNKGVIGIGLVLAIILGIVVVGGGAYYVGTNKSEDKKIVENPVVNVEENLQVEENKISESNSATITASQKCVDAAKLILPEYISRGQLLDFKLNKIELFALKSDASGSQYFTGNPTNDACMVSVSYSIKPKPEFYVERLAGNGKESTDGWIVNKSGFATIDKNSSGYYISSMGTGY
jgi:hypothetical protein